MIALKTNGLRYPLSLVLLVFALWLTTSCKCHKKHLSTADSLLVKDSVSLMAANIARDVSAKGPTAWLNYFEDTPAFFMTSNGQLVFHDHQSAQLFIQDTLIHIISKITLHWSNLRIDPLASSIAVMGAYFHEDITFTTGKTSPADGYFTGTAHLTAKGWKLRNANWSAKNPQ